MSEGNNRANGRSYRRAALPTTAPRRPRSVGGPSRVDKRLHNLPLFFRKHLLTHHLEHGGSFRPDRLEVRPERPEPAAAGPPVPSPGLFQRGTGRACSLFEFGLELLQAFRLVRREGELKAVGVLKQGRDGVLEQGCAESVQRGLLGGEELRCDQGGDQDRGSQ